MSGEAQAAEVADAPAEVVEAAQSEPVETEARRLGWRPKDEFKGPEDKWIEAEAFVAKGREILPIVQANNKALEAKVKELEKTLSEAKAYFSKVEQRTEKRAYAAAVRDIEARMDEAVAQGDTAAARALTKEATDLAADAKSSQTSAADDDKATVATWQADNDWFGKDEDMTAYARGLLFPEGTPLSEQLRLISEKTKKAFAKPTDNPRRAAAAAVEGAQVGRRTASETWANLSPAARETGDRFIKQGFVKDRETYAREYFKNEKAG